MGSRSFCFTINNYDDEQVKLLKDLEGRVRYLVFGQEVGESGTPHLQGYVELFKTARIGHVTELLGGRAHIEQRRGTREQARDYCIKGGRYIEIGNWDAGGQGKRNDVRSIIDEVKRGTSRRAIIEAFPEASARCSRLISDYRADVERDNSKAFRHVEVTVLVGPAGCGKTRYVHENETDVFTVNAGETFPFDGYDGEDAILIDDFYGGIKYHELLRILDGHQYRVNVKGGHRYAAWKRVYITSNQKADLWYNVGMTDALKRRLTKVVNMEV